MKKLLTLFTLLLTVCSGAWADDPTVTNPATVTKSVILTASGSATSQKFLDVANTTPNVDETYLTYDCTGNTGNHKSTLTASGNTWYSGGTGNTGNVSSQTFNSTTMAGFISWTGTTNVSCLYVRSTSRQRVFYITGATAVAVLGADQGDSQKLTIAIQELTTESDPATVGTDAVGASTNTSLHVLPHGSTLDASKFYKVSVQGSGTSNNAFFGQIRFTPGAAAAKISTTTSINEPGGFNKDIKNSTTAGTLTATVTPEGESALASPTITWSSDDEDVAKVGETTGVVTLVAAGTANITATYAGDGTYAGSFDTFELDVTDSRPEIHPTLTYDNPTLILGVTTTANPSLSGNTGGAEVEYSSDNTAVATVDSELGVVTAHAVGTAHITASVAATSEYRAGSVQATITVINDPFGDHTVTWTLSPLDSNNKSLTSESNSTSTYLNNIAEINHTKVGLSDSPSKASNRTAKVNRTAGKDDNKYVYVTFDVEDGYYFIPSSISVKVANVSTVTTFDAELVDEHDVTVSETGKTFASTDGTVETWTIENEDNGKSMSGTVTLKIYGYAETAGSYRFGNQIQILGKVVEAVPVTISDKKYATFASDRKLDFSGVEGLYAYTATVTFDELTFTKVTGSTAAEEGLLLYSETAKTYNVPVATGNPAKVSGNKLVRGEGTAVASDGEGETKNYVLSMNGAGEVNFYLANGNTVPTSKAYLKNIPVAATSKIFLPTGEDETDGIRSIENSELRIEDSDYYNLAGQKVGKDYKGIVIVNGKKVIRK